jgi:Flp pilus assembly protein TadB
MADSTPEATPLPPPATQRPGAWAVGAFAFVALIAASVVSVGLAAIVWVPLLMGIAISMVAIASARRRRQSTQGRNSDEIKDPTHAHPLWPTKGVIDDRLPEP